MDWLALGNANKDKPKKDPVPKEVIPPPSEAEEKPKHEHRRRHHRRSHHKPKENEEAPKDELPKEELPQEELPKAFDVNTMVPQDKIQTVTIKPPKRRKRPKKVPSSDKPDKPPGPIASKVVYLKRPPEDETKEEEQLKEGGEWLPDDAAGDALTEEQLTQKLVPEAIEAPEDKLIDLKLTQLIDIRRGEMIKKMKKSMKKAEPTTFTFSELLNTLKQQGIPCPLDDDYSRLQGQHTRWDPDGTVVEYFSPMLRTFIPINMRGRYRGCWNTDDCIKGLDISKVPPKRDALEGFVERGRHQNIQEKYNEMSSVAIDEAHLDYLIEIQTYQAETLPIPIFYDILHLGIEVANENLRLLVQEEGYPPTNPIFKSAQDHAEQVRRKIHLYGALGLETLESKRRGLGKYNPQWLMTRDEAIRQIMKRKDTERYTHLQEMEKEANERERYRREMFDQEMNKPKPKKRSKGSGDKPKGNKVAPGRPSE